MVLWSPGFVAVCILLNTARQARLQDAFLLLPVRRKVPSLQAVLLPLASQAASF
jgi:hypothetical protein